MKLVSIAFALFVFCTYLDTSYAFDWKKLHDFADNISLPQALKELEANPDPLDALYVAGLVYFNIHKDAQAREIFIKMREIDPHSVGAMWGMAESLRRQHKLEEAAHILEELIGLAPEYSPAYISLGYIRYIQMSFEDTVKLMLSVIKQGKDNVDKTNFVRAHCLYAGAKGMIAHYGGPLSKAVNGAAVMRHLRIAQDIQPDNIAVFFGMGSYYLLIPPIFGRDLDKALEYLEKAKQIDPLFPDVYVRLAQVYKLKGDEDAYLAYLEKALALDPRHEIALDIKNGTCNFICVAE